MSQVHAPVLTNRGVNFFIVESVSQLRNISRCSDVLSQFRKPGQYGF